MATVMYLQGMKQMAEEGGGVKDWCVRLLCGRLGEGSCNEPFRDRPAESRDRLAYRVSVD